MNQGEVEAYRILTETAEALAATDGRSLEFRASPLATLPRALFLLTQLETLELTENELKTLPPELARLRSLLRLNLSYNRLVALPAELGQLSSLLRLDLSHNELQTIPPEVGQLVNLLHLDLTNNALVSLPPKIGQLRNLGVLNVSDNQLSSLPDEIGDLHVDDLNLSGNRLVSLPAEVGKLANLGRLNLSNNSLRTLPSQIGGLKRLMELRASGNELIAVPPQIGDLASLDLLDLSENQLADLPDEMGKLSRLDHLDLSSNRITTLPPGLGHLRDSLYLEIDDNPLAAPIPELLQRGTPELLAYLRSVLEAGRPQYEAKLVLVGEGNVGKTSLVAALNNEAFVENRPTTHGIRVGQLQLPHPRLATELTLNTWDFGGQEVYRITHQFFFSRRCLYIVVWRPREGQEENAIEAWCKRIRLRVGSQARIMLVATHADEGRRAELDYPYLQRQFGSLLVGHHSIDSQSGRGIDELRHAIAEQAAKLPQMGELISTRWTGAHEELKTLKTPQISNETFVDVCKNHGLDNKQIMTFSGLLHDLGHIIHYGEDDGLRDIVVLQPEWLTKAIGYVLEDQPTELAGGLLEHARLRSIWDNADHEVRYPAIHHPYFLRLMEKFDVSYRIFDLSDDRSLIGQLVPYEEPSLPWTKHSELPQGMRQLSATCEMAEGAEGLVAWLTVRNHRFSTGRHWRRGVFLEHRGQAAQGLLILQNERQLELVVRAPSPDYFFSILRDSIEDLITRRWKGLDYSLLAPCAQILPNGTRCSGQFKLETLQGYRERDRLTIDCHSCFESQDVTQLLTGFAHEDVPLARVLDEFSQRTEELKLEVRDRSEEVKVENRQALAAHTAMVANQLRVILRAVSAEFPDCPRLFTIIPDRSSSWRLSEVWEERFELTLWCERPGSEHPWPAARYKFDNPKEWFVTVAPYLVALSRLLRAVVPIGGAALGVALPEEEFKRIDKDLDLMKTLAQQLPGGGDEDRLDLEINAGTGRVEGADLRALRMLLLRLDPAMGFGGLRRVLSPSGDYLWICSTPEHLRDYDPGLPDLT
jgi:internalin A